MSKLELIKRLETFIAFQAGCLSDGNWDDFDKAENQVKELEKEILHWKE